MTGCEFLYRAHKYIHVTSERAKEKGHYEAISKMLVDLNVWYQRLMNMVLAMDFKEISTTNYGSMISNDEERRIFLKLFNTFVSAEE